MRRRRVGQREAPRRVVRTTSSDTEQEKNEPQTSLHSPSPAAPPPPPPPPAVPVPPPAVPVPPPAVPVPPAGLPDNLPGPVARLSSEEEVVVAVSEGADGGELDRLSAFAVMLATVDGETTSGGAPNISPSEIR